MLPTLLALLLAAPAGMVRVGPASYRPPFPPADGPQEVRVGAFWLDATPVTIAEYEAFVKAHPRWRRDEASKLFVDASYLEDWAGPAEAGPGVDPQAPVTQVTWFAAKAYCEAQGARLPTVDEWEMAAAADAKRADATDDPAFTNRILSWYARRTPEKQPPVGQGEANLWGAHDLHGLVWEWVLDFNSALVTGDSREGGAADRALFCGASALGARDARNYAAFMRSAFRSSLVARYASRNLGFRCARDAASEDEAAEDGGTEDDGTETPRTGGEP